MADAGAIFDMAELQRRIRDRLNEQELMTSQGAVLITCTPSSTLAAWTTEVVFDFLNEYIEGGII